MKKTLLRYIFLSLILLVATFRLQAQDISAQQSRKERLEREIAILDRQIRDNTSQNASVLSRISLVRNRINSRQALINESDREIADYNTKIAAKQRQISSIEQKLDTMTLAYGKLVKNAYKNRDARVWYMYILASDNLGQGLRRYNFLKDLSNNMNTQAKEITKQKELLESEKKTLEKLRSDAAKLRAERVLELDKLKSEEADAQKLTAQLNRQKTKYQRELNSKKKEAQNLEREIKRAISRAMSSSSSSSGSSKSSKKKEAAPIDYKLGGAFASNKGKLPWPAQGAIVSRFGKQYHPVFKSLQLPPNNGISIAVEPDSDVTAVYDGVVAQISIFPGYHQCILVQHGNYFTLYAKIKTAYVKPGEKISTGQKIGTVDTIDGETVFHFEIWNEKTVAQNPESWLRPR